MKFSEFLKIYKGDIVSVRDNSQSYGYKEEEEIADREVEKITHDENGVHILLVRDESIPVVDFLSVSDNIFLRVYDEKLKTTTKASKEDAIRMFSNYKITKYTIYEGCLLICVKKMKEV